LWINKLAKVVNTAKKLKSKLWKATSQIVSCGLTYGILRSRQKTLPRSILHSSCRRKGSSNEVDVVQQNHRALDHSSCAVSFSCSSRPLMSYKKKTIGTRSIPCFARLECVLKLTVKTRHANSLFGENVTLCSLFPRTARDIPGQPWHSCMETVCWSWLASGRFKINLDPCIRDNQTNPDS